MLPVLLGLLMISTLGVEAKHTPKTHKPHYKHNHYHENGYRNRKGEMIHFEGRMFLFRQGVFFKRTPYGMTPVEARPGMVVSYIPWYSKVVRTRFGLVYQYNGAFFKRLPFGEGFVVMRNPWAMRNDPYQNQGKRHRGKFRGY